MGFQFFVGLLWGVKVGTTVKRILTYVRSMDRESQYNLVYDREES